MSGELWHLIFISVSCTRQNIFSPKSAGVHVWAVAVGLIKIHKSSSGYGGTIIWVSLGSWAPFISLGLAVPGRCEPCLVPLFMTLSLWHQVALPVLFSPQRWMSVKCAAKDNNSCWQKNTGLPHIALTSRTRETQVMANAAQSFHSHKIWRLYFKQKKKIQECSNITQHSLGFSPNYTWTTRLTETAWIKRMMWQMDSDLAGLRPLAGIGLSLNDCSDLPIHQSRYVKAGAASTEWQPWNQKKGLVCPLHHRPHKTFKSPYHWGEKTAPLSRKNKCPGWILIRNFRGAADEWCPHHWEHIMHKGCHRQVIWQPQCKQKWHCKLS